MKSIFLNDLEFYKACFNMISPLIGICDVTYCTISIWFHKLYLSFNYLCAIYQESYALYLNNKIDLILGLKGIVISPVSHLFYCYDIRELPYWISQGNVFVSFDKIFNYILAFENLINYHINQNLEDYGYLINILEQSFIDVPALIY